MGFLGFAFILIFISILINLMIVFAGIFLIAGFILYKTHQTIAIILFVLAGLNFLGFTAFKIYEKTFRVDIETPSGIVKIRNYKCSEYEKYVKNMDVEKVNEMLAKYPALIYHEVFDDGRKLLLFYGLQHCNVDMMQCALKHGEQFNDPKLNIKSDFLYRFFQNVNGDTTTEMIDTLKFAFEHGANVVYEHWDLYEDAEDWVKNDGVVSEKDNELLDLIAKYDNKPISERLIWGYLYRNK